LALDNESWVETLPTEAETPTDIFIAPVEFLAAARETFDGRIPLDPASCWDANVVVCAEEFFDQNDDGLSLPWYMPKTTQPSKVWLNPDFNNGKAWVLKAITELERGHVQEAIVLLMARSTGTDYAQRLMKYAGGLCLPGEHFNFGGKGLNRPSGWANVIVYVGENYSKFSKAFSQVGFVADMQESSLNALRMIRSKLQTL
jgi:hypothetical protein